MNFNYNGFAPNYGFNVLNKNSYTTNLNYGVLDLLFKEYNPNPKLFPIRNPKLSLNTIALFFSSIIN